MFQLCSAAEFTELSFLMSVSAERPSLHVHMYVPHTQIKVTHPSLGKTRVEREKSMGKLLNEVTIMKEQLRHPSVVRYHKAFQESGHLYIVMELLEGASLYEHVSSLKEKGQRFTEEQIWRMFLQVCRVGVYCDGCVWWVCLVGVSLWMCLVGMSLWVCLVGVSL